ncbi:MAG: hypothetical protein AB7V27_16065 [Candidatus Binatia bacterium]
MHAQWPFPIRALDRRLGRPLIRGEKLPIKGASALTLLGLFLMSPSLALGGTFTTKVDKGSTASVAVTTASGTTTTTVTDTNGDGNVTVTIANQGNVCKTVACKVVNGDQVCVTHTYQCVIAPLPTIEPFDLPTFGPLNPPDRRLITVIEVNAFLAEGVSFAEGQTVGVVNGAVTETPTIMFKDGTGVVSGDLAQAARELSDPAFVAALPDFTGTVLVLAPDEFRFVRPAPVFDAVTLIVLIGALLLIGATRSSGRTAAAIRRGGLAR